MRRRHLNDFGVPAIPALILIAIVFTAFSFSLFQKLSYAGYVYVLLALSFVIRNGDRQRNEFLKSIFSDRQYFTIRLLENILLIIPFLLFLCFKQEFLLGSSLLLLSSILSAVNIRMPEHVSLPTPFYKRPFEFVTGFRRLWFLFIAGFAVIIIAVIYHNANLGLFTLVIIFLLCTSFYSEPEDEFYVWIHSLDAGAFLKQKIRIALAYSSLLTIPAAILLIVFFTSISWMILLLQILGYCYLITVLLGKYSVFPGRMSLLQSILLAAGIVIPPLILLLGPFFYIQSKKQLGRILV